MSEHELGWIKKNPPPDLQALVQRWGGYTEIPEEEWRRWDEETRRWQQARRDRWLR